MNRTAKATARKVANGTATPAESKDFRASVLLMGWEGARGLGVVNYTTQERVKSFRALAQILLEEAGDAEAALDRTEELEAAEMAADEADANEWGQAAKAWAESPTPDPEPAPVTMFLYRTQTPTIRLTNGSAVDAVVTEEIIGVTEGPCQSGASLECDPEDRNLGLLRTLPESMLPGQERAIMLQCLPCYEASAEAYVRKLHHRASE